VEQKEALEPGGGFGLPPEENYLQLKTNNDSFMRFSTATPQKIIQAKRNFENFIKFDILSLLLQQFFPTISA
jgi:hypothetical protein